MALPSMLTGFCRQETVLLIGILMPQWMILFRVCNTHERASRVILKIGIIRNGTGPYSHSLVLLSGEVCLRSLFYSCERFFCMTDPLFVDNTIIEWSEFDAQRYNVTSTYNTEIDGAVEFGDDYNWTWKEEFDLRRDLDLSEDTLNEFLANMSFSLLNLDTRRVPLPVKIMEHRSTYHFSRPMNLIIPYALSLDFALVFIGIGILSLMANGVPAMDGGFLQVATATTSRTEMDKLIESDNGEDDKDGVRRQLLGMKIRYGELVDDGGVSAGRAGFGTPAETKPLGTRTGKE
ncbi:hypothetical protein IG631_16821 [Alternaria alternata]|nr:hypothetical protein IG631_16821 [Alternaria alternata]